MTGMIYQWKLYRQKNKRIKSQTRRPLVAMFAPLLRTKKRFKIGESKINLPACIYLAVCLQNSYFPLFLNMHIFGPFNECVTVKWRSLLYGLMRTIILLHTVKYLSGV